MPVNTSEHWVLLQLDMKIRTLFLYDSIRSDAHDEDIKGKLQRYTVLLPYFLRLAGVWKVKKKSKGNREQSEEINPLELLFVNGLLKQQSLDCGAFVLAFAEYFTANSLDLFNPYFDNEDYHMHVACLLYHYAMMKAANNVENDDEEMVVQPKNAKRKKTKKL